MTAPDSTYRPHRGSYPEAAYKVLGEHAFRVDLFSDGQLRIEWRGQIIELEREQTEQLVRFLDRLAPEGAAYKPMTVDALMGLTVEFGDGRDARLRAAIEQYGREQGFESTAQRDVREACYELRDALGNPVISGTGDQTIQGQTIRMAAARLRGSGAPVALDTEPANRVPNQEPTHQRERTDTMEDESLSDIAVSTAAAIHDAVLALRGMNDYGASTGFCSELDQIESDAHRQLFALRARAYAVKRRYSLLATEKGLTP